MDRGERRRPRARSKSELMRAGREPFIGGQTVDGSRAFIRCSSNILNILPSCLGPRLLWLHPKNRTEGSRNDRGCYCHGFFGAPFPPAIKFLLKHTEGKATHFFLDGFASVGCTHSINAIDVSLRVQKSRKPWHLSWRPMHVYGEAAAACGSACSAFFRGQSETSGNLSFPPKRPYGGGCWKVPTWL
jgi:hypothetical protein